MDYYRAFGVKNIWVLDPRKRRAYVCMLGDFRQQECEAVTVADSPSRIPLKGLFAELDC